MTHLLSHLFPVTQTFPKFFILHPPPVRQTISVLEKKELHNRLCPSVSWSVSSQFSFSFVSILHLLVSPFNLHAPLLTFRSSCLLSCPQALWLLSCPLSSLHTHPSLLAGHQVSQDGLPCPLADPSISTWPTGPLGLDQNSHLPFIINLHQNN